MATADVQNPVQPKTAPAIPDYLADPDAVLHDASAKWRYGRAPDYSKTRTVYAETKHMNHVAGSLEDMVENLVKNWEVEASFKPELADWRTVDHSNYSFAINGGPPQTGEYMLKVGTYNAIIAPSEYYSPEYSDFASSHKTFKRMMPTFAWEVIEVYSGPPKVAFKWRHWGTMKNDYVGFNDKGEKVTAKAHGGPIDITGITVATVDDKVRLQAVNTYFDPLEMFRQIAPNGIVNKQIIDKKIHSVDMSAALEPDLASNDGVKIAEQHNEGDTSTQGSCPVSGASMSAMSGCPVINAAMSSSSSSSSSSEHPKRSIYSSSVTGNVEDRMRISDKPDYSQESGTFDDVDRHLEKPAAEVHPHPHDMENAVKPAAGEAVVAGPLAQETKSTHEEMSSVTSKDNSLISNRE